MIYKKTNRTINRETDILNINITTPIIRPLYIKVNLQDILVQNLTSNSYRIAVTIHDHNWRRLNMKELEKHKTF